MLFSQKQVADYLNQHFECAWEELRPVPQVSIDFGNGHRLRRTLNGNVATWLCDSEGRPADILAGLATPKSLLERCRSIDELIKDMRVAKKAAAQARRAQTGLGNPGPTPVINPSTLLRMPAYLASASKMGVEAPLKLSLAKKTTTLEKDDEYNRRVRDNQCLAILWRHPNKGPRELAKPIFKQVLDVNLDDPFLGLAPKVLGGEVGRSYARK